MKKAFLISICLVACLMLVGSLAVAKTVTDRNGPATRDIKVDGPNVGSPLVDQYLPQEIPQNLNLTTY